VPRRRKANDNDDQREDRDFWRDSPHAGFWGPRGSVPKKSRVLGDVESRWILPADRGPMFDAFEQPAARRVVEFCRHRQAQRPFGLLAQSFASVGHTEEERIVGMIVANGCQAAGACSVEDLKTSGRGGWGGDDLCRSALCH